MLPPPNPWGWKTRPRDPNSLAPDDAVIVTDPLEPLPGSVFVGGYPIWWPTPESSWDMAFELISAQPEPKWMQPFDPASTALDVNASVSSAGVTPYILANDFPCTETGPITQIAIYGSLLFGSMPPEVAFTLSLHADNPIGPGYGMPGELLWSRTFAPGEYSVEWVGTFAEGWLDPPEGWEPAGPARDLWACRFNLSPGEFVQQGTPGEPEPVIYWLDVQAGSAGPAADPFGWKTSESHWRDDAVWGSGGEPYAGPWDPLVYPPDHPYAGDTIDLAFEIWGNGPGLIKWTQPPQPYDPPDAFEGWDQLSMYGQQLAADDWVCASEQPVTGIHWWGSFIGWYHPYVPDTQGPPDAFHIAIWTDAPPDPTGPDSFSHPDIVLWETWCESYDWEFVGWDFDPREIDPLAPPPEATFRFTQCLEETAWFWQPLPSPEDNLLWISIAAVYYWQDPQYAWGWKTRPQLPTPSATTDAVAIFDPTAPAVGAQFVAGMPLWYPTPAESWDLAFELTTRPEPFGDLVVCEPQGMDPGHPFHPPTYWYDVTPASARCDFHVRVFDPTPGNYTNVFSPPTWQFAVHQLDTGEWWASWWDPDCSDPIALTTRFQFDNSSASTWSHWTTTEGSSSDPYALVADRSENHDCRPDGYGYRVHVPGPPAVQYFKWEQPPTPQPTGYFWGWNELSLFEGPQFAADDWMCTDMRPVTDIHWWGSYLGWVESMPPPEAPCCFHIGMWTDVPPSPEIPWSHPGVLVREWWAMRAELNEQPVGLDYHPEYGVESCFQYDYVLPAEQWFAQPLPPPAENIFWISLAAAYDVGPPTFPWGWKTRQPHWRDDAVRIFAPLPPFLDAEFQEGEPIMDATGLSWDMAFTLTTFEAPSESSACCLENGACIETTPYVCVQQFNGVPFPGLACAEISPLILEQPEDIDACENDNVALAVAACGLPPVHYQWQHDGVPVGPDSPILPLPDIRPPHAGMYDVLVTDAAGDLVASDPAVVTVQMKGDANCDDELNAFDIDPFVLALTDRALWEDTYWWCDYLCANDVNRDGAVNAFDIDPFVELLTGD